MVGIGLNMSKIIDMQNGDIFVLANKIKDNI